MMGELLAKIPLYGFEFLLASWLVINQYAEWAALGLIYRMAPYAHLGGLSYFNKRYPLLLGKGQTLAAKNLHYHTSHAINAIILSIALLAFFLFFFQQFGLVVLLTVLTVLVMQIFTYCQAKLRNEGDFLAYTLGLLIFSLLQFCIAYFTVKKYGVLAGVLSTFFAYFFAVLYYLMIARVNYLFFLPKTKRLIRVLRLGWAPFLLTISAFLIQVSDRVALVLLNDKTKLAFYGFFALFLQLGIVMINALGKVLGPYIIFLSGKKRPEDTLFLSLSTCYAIILLYIFLSFFLRWQGENLLNHFFPSFTGSLLGVFIYATIGVLLSLSLAFYPQLMAASKEALIIKMNLGYFFLSTSIIYFLGRVFPGFAAYSFASLGMNFLYSMIFIKIIEKLSKKKIYPLWLMIFIIFLMTLFFSPYFYAT